MPGLTRIISLAFRVIPGSLAYAMCFKLELNFLFSPTSLSHSKNWWKSFPFAAAFTVPLLLRPDWAALPYLHTFAPMSCLKVPPRNFIKANFCSSSASLVESYFFYDSFCHFLKIFFSFNSPSPIREGGFFTPTGVGSSSRVPFPQTPIVSEEKTKLRRIAVRPGPSLVTLVRKGNRAINRASAQN